MTGEEKFLSDVCRQILSDFGRKTKDEGVLSCVHLRRSERSIFYPMSAVRSLVSNSFVLRRLSPVFRRLSCVFCPASGVRHLASK